MIDWTAKDTRNATRFLVAVYAAAGASIGLALGGIVWLIFG